MVIASPTAQESPAKPRACAIGEASRPRWGRCIAWALCTSLGPLGSLACSPGLVPTLHPGPRGQANHGLLARGRSLGPGPGRVLARPGDPTRWGTPQLVAALERASAAVHERFAGGAPLRVGDLSYRHGGRHPRHGSHRSGHDADLIFYVTDRAGRSARGRGWLAFDRFGVARELRVPGEQAPSGELFFFDTARNWHLVRSLLDDPSIAVQWLFCSRGVEARLLRYAVRHEPDSRLLARAAAVLHQPSQSRSHNDHFHLRILCSPQARASGCRDYGPRWPWLLPQLESQEVAAAALLDDATLLRLLLDEPG